MSCSREEMYQALPTLPYCKRQKTGRGTGNKARKEVRKVLVSEPDSQPKGGGDSGTVASTAICSPRNFGG